MSGTIIYATAVHAGSPQRPPPEPWSRHVNLALSMPSQHARRSRSRGTAVHLLSDAKVSSPILAAGGIVLGEGSRPRIAIVRLRRDKSWVLPKGKLYPGEHALAAARREVCWKKPDTRFQSTDFLVRCCIRWMAESRSCSFGICAPSADRGAS